MVKASTRLFCALALSFGLKTPALDLSAGAGPLQGCADTGFGSAATAEVSAYLEPAPVVTVNEYGDGRYDPSPAQNRGVAVGFGELTAGADGYCIGVLYRAEYRAEASKDLLDALVANHFGLPFDAGRHYLLSMNEDGFRADGIRLRKVMRIEISADAFMRIGLGTSLLRGLQGQQQSLTGDATATSGNYAVGTASWLRTESNLGLSDFNPFVPYAAPHAAGFSTDAEVLLTLAGWSADATVIDAVGRLYWRNVPHSLRVLNNAAITYNANLDRDAFINGVDSRVSFDQRLEPKYRMLLQTPFEQHYQAFIEDDFVDGLHFPSLGLRFGSADRHVELNGDIRTHAIGLGVKFWSLDASVTANSLHVGAATALGAAMQFMHSW